jgi:acyl-CoA synthetase (AMP-forming)/AMP-acid ligase II
MGARRPGWVGRPLPGVETKVDLHQSSNTEDVAVGDLKVKGPNVFSEYWNKPQATKDTFDNDVYPTLKALATKICTDDDDLFRICIGIGMVCYR